MTIFRRIGSLIASTFGIDRSEGSPPPADTASDRAHEVARSRTLDRGPSLRWRIRRWILRRLDAWPREKSGPTTEWGRMRRRERRRLVEEVERLRAIEAWLEREWPSLLETIHADLGAGDT